MPRCIKMTAADFSKLGVQEKEQALQEQADCLLQLATSGVRLDRSEIDFLDRIGRKHDLFGLPALDESTVSIFGQITKDQARRTVPEIKTFLIIGAVILGFVAIINVAGLFRK